MLNDAAKALELGMDLKRNHWRILVRVGWVLAVSAHIAYVCGVLAIAGVGAAPFARAADVDKLLRAAEASARINMQQELRVQTRVWCENPDAEVRGYAYRRIEDLRRDLFEIARLQTPEPSCPTVAAAADR